jgi:hypothetical protein
MKKHRLTNDKYTDNVDEYLDDWHNLGKDICSMYEDGEAELVAFDPGILIAVRLDGNNFSISLGTDLARRISKLVKR